MRIQEKKILTTEFADIYFDEAERTLRDNDNKCLDICLHHDYSTAGGPELIVLCGKDEVDFFIEKLKEKRNEIWGCD